MIRTLELVAGALSVLALLAMIALVLRRLALIRAQRRLQARERALRPLALALIDGEEPELPLRGAEARTLAALLGRYSRKLRGESSERIAAFFERRGDVDRELRRLRSPRRSTRATAAFSLGDLRSPRAIEPLIAALDDRSRDVRSAAARSLGHLRAEGAVPRLVRSLAGQDVPRPVAGDALLAIGPNAVPHLRTLAGSDDAAVRAIAIELIGYTGEAAHGELVRVALRDASAEVRAAAARSLGRLGARSAAAELREALGDPAAFVRTSAAHALGRIGDRDAAEALALVAQVDEYDPAQAAAHALATIDPMRTIRAGDEKGASAHLAEAAALAELA